jgi:ATP dependent DNA ligase domain
MAAMTTASALAIVRDLRPQAFGNVAPNRVSDPIVEPLWSGVRVLAAVEGNGSGLFDIDGDPVVDYPAVESSLRDSGSADEIVVDGYLTKQAAHDGTGTMIGAEPMPSTGAMLTQGLVGSRRNRAAEHTDRLEREREARTFGPDDVIVFVAIDLLYLDGESLLDIPLLERKRLLEAVLAESDLVRRGAYVRPPIDTWVNSWRALGFAGLTYKAANGRYRPGGTKDDWATAPMPRR